ncbi:hypothetical protein ACFV3R_08935 [Streptomyces sp. NPDC059740]|uniref:hypothetical protein n=1 Tax=Streptomyces sp. NPDC059740 TaxID=3346926 RepID=UPI0036553F60
MNDNTKLSLAAALAGGYVLGRSKKTRTAMLLASYLAGRRLATSPRQLLGRELRRLSDSPQFARVSDQLREELVGAGRSALSSLAARRVNSLADLLHDRSELLRNPAGDGQDSGEDRDREEAAGEPPEEEREGSGRRRGSPEREQPQDRDKTPRRRSRPTQDARDRSTDGSASAGRAVRQRPRAER